VPVHDEIILDVPMEHLDDAADTLRRVMNDDQMFSVPLSASVSHGQSWGSKESYVHRS
jgi:DNA polymerase I-like protein with 3'-5' exonuclease and polymerase domains